MKNPQISVIVPVYNVEKYLPICIDSILQQSFTDFELLLIDDGSLDNSGAICDEYAQKDERIRVFHQKNGGVSTARNLGLNNALGKYICFVDSDDSVEADYLKRLIDALLEDREQIGLIIGGFKIYTPEGKDIGEVKLSRNLFYTADFGKAFVEDNICKLGYVCSKLYNNSILKINNIRFNEKIHCCEDLLFMLNYLFYCDYLLFNDSLDYNYVKYPVSQSYIVNSFESEYEAFIIYLRLIKRSCERYNIDSLSMSSTWNSLMVIFRRALKTGYLPGQKMNRKKRLANIKMIVKGNEALLKAYYNPTYKLDKIGKRMLLSHCFKLFDWYMNCLFSCGVKAIFLGEYNAKK